jgi:uroporphyrinogen-III decarboxylase
VALVPAMHRKHVKGIRDAAEWYVSLSLRPGYVHDVFERQCEIGIANLARAYEVVGDKVTAVCVGGTDLGAQQGPLVSPRTYRDLFKPFQVQVNSWVHAHTGWKTFIHSCGSIWALLDDIVDAGFDVLNPVQTSAADMSPEALKERYGDRLTFWGGGVDTQRVLPFGTPDEVRAMVRDRLRIFGRGGGFVFNTVHNVQAGVPTENLLALYQAVGDFRAH